MPIARTRGQCSRARAHAGAKLLCLDKHTHRTVRSGYSVITRGRMDGRRVVPRRHPLTHDTQAQALASSSRPASATPRHSLSPHRRDTWLPPLIRRARLRRASDQRPRTNALALATQPARPTPARAATQGTTSQRARMCAPTTAAAGARACAGAMGTGSAIAAAAAAVADGTCAATGADAACMGASSGPDERCSLRARTGRHVAAARRITARDRHSASHARTGIQL